ncbi:hypothetical protein DICVIV_04744 [Dictyocaulus viviparus]|uniref:Uncharacterized protein n=1 Tax=Dictyocaulus viviparus TaxID=29172 RepID=A0A0D8XZB5_DICVI|nr:hypothetical protein DICVIV_04744 [Dictyocaulus viviparus]
MNWECDRRVIARIADIQFCVSLWFNTLRMISLTGRRSPIVIILTSLTIARCESHVPSLTEIAHIKDPVLSEVFASSGITNKKVMPEFEDHPQLPQKYMHSPQKRIYYELVKMFTIILQKINLFFTFVANIIQSYKTIYMTILQRNFIMVSPETGKL